MYELMPFDNELVAMELSGKVVKEFINHIANDGGWPVSQSVKVSRNNGLLSVKINGREIQADKQYVIALPDYVAGGGGDSSMLRGKEQIKSGHLVRDLLIEYAGKATGPLTVTATGDRMNINR
jgi:2',3'-cyclic-nucleotide 2'-phosphodiesterase (5'-nucleotidase family)